MSAEAPPATGNEPFQVVASQKPHNFTNELRAAFNMLRRRRRQ